MVSTHAGPVNVCSTESPRLADQKYPTSQLLRNPTLPITVGEPEICPFALKLQRTSRGILVEGNGRMQFCPCLGTPISLGFKSVTVAPPGDLFITSPRLEIFKVPVFWLPWF